MKYLLFYGLLLLLSCNDTSDKAVKSDTVYVSKPETIFVKKEDVVKVSKQVNEKKEESITELPATDTTDTTPLKDDIPYEEWIVGRWNITMTCTESDCEGITVSDIKTEVWSIEQTAGILKVYVIENSNTNKSYKGYLFSKDFEFNGTYTGLFENAKIKVNGKLLNDHTFEGTRTLQKSDPCRSVYKIKAKKQ